MIEVVPESRRFKLDVADDPLSINIKMSITINIWTTVVPNQRMKPDITFLTAGLSEDIPLSESDPDEKPLIMLENEINTRNTTAPSPPMTINSVSTNDSQVGRPFSLKYFGIGNTTIVITAASKIGFKMEADALIPQAIMNVLASASSKETNGGDFESVMLIALPTFLLADFRLVGLAA